MKRIALTCLVGFLTATAAFAADGASEKLVLYGLINQEARIVSNPSATGRNVFTGITGVDGFESRFGARGKDGIFSYKMEIGVNPSVAASATGDRIRVRMVTGTLDFGSAGKLQVGQEWTPWSLLMIKWDPLSRSSAEAYGLDDTDFASTGVAAKGLGYHFRAFQDQISYSIAPVAGLDIALTYDRSLPNLNKVNPTGATGFTTTIVDYLTATAKYQIATSDDSSLTLAGEYGSRLSISNVPATPEAESFLNFGAAFAAKGFGLAATFGDEKVAGTAKRTRLFLGASKALSDEVDLVASFADLMRTANLNSGGSEIQVSVGGIYKATKDLSFRLVPQIRMSKVDTGVLASGQNSATMFRLILGLTYNI